jgi:choline-glycine betaine transporter
MAQPKESLNLQKFIISIVIIGVFLIVGIYINEMISLATDAENTAVTITNETGAWINSTIYVVDQSTVEDFAAFTLTSLFNATDGTSIGLLNVTTTSTGFYNATAVHYNDVLASYTYTWTAPTNASEAADDVVDALATGTSWISILVVVGFATIILTMLTSGLGNAARREMEVPYY